MKFNGPQEMWRGAEGELRKKAEEAAKGKCANARWKRENKDAS